jgi:hypothetical protein
MPWHVPTIEYQVFVGPRHDVAVTEGTAKNMTNFPNCGLLRGLTRGFRKMAYSTFSARSIPALPEI